MTTRPSKGYRLPGMAVPAITQNQINAYLAISGDTNPLHYDLELAQRAGLADITIPGMQVMAQVSMYLSQWKYCAQVNKLSTRFTSPAYVNQGITLDARIVATGPEVDQVVMRLTATQDKRIVVMAEAKVTLMMDAS